MFGISGRVISGAGHRFTVPPSSTYRDTVLSLSPMTYWRLGEASGTNAVDEVGAQDGTYFNAPLLGTASLLTNDTNTSVEFVSGSIHYMQATNQTLFNTSLYSISMIIQMSTLPNVVRTISAVTGGGYNGGSKDKELWFQTNGTLRFHSYPGDSNFTDSSGPMPFNIPIHIVVSVDGTNTKLYINGVEDGTIASNGSYASFTDATQMVGTQGPSNAFDGIIDEVATWNRGLLASEALDLYNASI